MTASRHRDGNLGSTTSAIFLLPLLFWLTLGQWVRDIGEFSAGRGDFGQLYNAADRLNHSEHLYPRKNDRMYQFDLYLYPPLPALVLKPLAKLSPMRAVQIWCVLNIFWLASGTVITVSALGYSWRDSAQVSLVAMSLLRFWPMQANLMLGQINPFIFAMIGAAFWANSRNRLYLMAAILVACIMVKTWLAALLLYFVLRKAWGPMVFGIVTFAVAMSLSFFIVGWRELQPFIETSRAYAIQPLLQSNSILGTAFLFFSRNPLISPLVDNRLLFVVSCAIGFGAVVAGLVGLYSR
jgi:hypothetical protein